MFLWKHHNHFKRMTKRLYIFKETSQVERLILKIHDVYNDELLRIGGGAEEKGGETCFCNSVGISVLW